jgi:hypothetical protein
MIEVAFLVLVVLLIIIIWVYYIFSREWVIAARIDRQIALTKSRITLAEKKFLQRKISKNIFNSLMSGFESDLVSYELERAAFGRPRELVVRSKADEILNSVPKPPKRIKVKIIPLLRETEKLRHEMKALEAKLLKREIHEGVFEKLMTSKQKDLIKKESELLKVLDDAHKGRMVEEIEANEEIFGA